jgi:ubiquitin-activating enzyme E1 C
MTTNPTSGSSSSGSPSGSSVIISSKTSNIKRDASDMTTTMTCDDDAPTAMTTSSSIDGSTRRRSSPLSRRQRGNLSTLLTRKSPFGNETGSLPVGEFDASKNCSGSGSNSAEESSKILVVGAGGLGCEILKDLAMCACGGDGGMIRDVVVIDLGKFPAPILHVNLRYLSQFNSLLLFLVDTIDVTNLNRQFLFRSKDIGHSKAETAARFINDRCPWMRVVPYHGKIQDKDATFYKQFKVVISGLDNVEARR